MPGSAVAQVLRLSNGRRLGYAEYGDRRGTPLLFFHATPGSRRVARWADRAARRRGIRLIAPDRPGFGLSDFEPGRTLGAWPADVCETGRCPRDRILCRGRGVARRPLCCRLRLADRGPLTNAGIVSGVGPLDDPALAAALPRGYRAEFALARWAPAAMRPALGLGRLGLRRAPGFVLARVAASLPEVDRAILARPQVRALLLDDAAEALRQGTRGAVQELALFGRPWGVPLGEVCMPVHLWYGEADAQVPVAIARRLAATLPECWRALRAARRPPLGARPPRRGPRGAGLTP